MTANLADYRRPVSQEEAVSRDRSRGLPVHGEYGSQHEARGYIKRRHRKKAGLMRQFIKQADGPCGSTPEYRDGWERIFGAPALPERPRRERAPGDREAVRQAEEDYFRRYLASEAPMRAAMVAELRGPPRHDTIEERERAKQMAEEQAAGLAAVAERHGEHAQAFAEQQRREAETAGVLGVLSERARREATELVIDGARPAVDAYTSNYERIDWGKR